MEMGAASPSMMGMGPQASGMSMGGTASSSMGMQMVFFSSTKTPLFSERLTPTTTGAYAGLCIFLIVLALTARCLLACRAVLENWQMNRDRKRRYIVVRDQPTTEQNILGDSRAKEGSLITTNGPEERVKILTAWSRPVSAWRFSVDLPRATITTIIAGLGYLLMLAVMTFNVGYFISVLAGIFIGDLAVGRYAAGGGEH